MVIKDEYIQKLAKYRRSWPAIAHGDIEDLMAVIGDMLTDLGIDWTHEDKTAHQESAHMKPTMKTPTLEEIMAWEARGGCYSITGDWVEPDGHGPDGAPSWMIYLGYI